MTKTLQISRNLGVAGLFVDAKSKDAKQYYQQFGFMALPEQLHSLFLSLASIIKHLNCLD